MKHCYTHPLVVCLLFCLTSSVAAQTKRAEHDVAAAVASNGSIAPANAFAQGTWTAYSFASASLGDADIGEMYAGHIGGGYYLLDSLAINVELFGAAIDTPYDDGQAAGMDLILRWHFYQCETWSLYVDGGAGIQQATLHFPDDSHNNFRPQMGLGLTYELHEDLRLMGGARLLHISNAGRSQSNRGFDGPMIYMGLMWSF